MPDYPWLDSPRKKDKKFRIEQEHNEGMNRTLQRAYPSRTSEEIHGESYKDKPHGIVVDQKLAQRLPIGNLSKNTRSLNGKRNDSV